MKHKTPTKRKIHKTLSHREESEVIDERYKNMPILLQDFFIELAQLSRFTVKFFLEIFKPPFEFREILNQAYKLGYQSLFLVGLSGFIIGLVMTLQVRPTMVDFGAESLIPSMISISLIREIGPVLTALICAGKVGSSIGAELGSMKVTEQIDAMAVSGANPYNYIVVTRVISTTLMVPILVFYADAIGLFGSYVALNINSNINIELYFYQALGALQFSDVFPATIKTFFFGFAIGVIGCFKGYNASQGTVGVGTAANSAVVLSSLTVFIIDMIAVQLTQIFVYN
ncbi:MAG TPA: ABC transporter permease [Cytophagales bacterium]|nr:ABC transporter permease [Cytophagales bacterium]